MQFRVLLECRMTLEGALYFSRRRFILLRARGKNTAMMPTMIARLHQAPSPGYPTRALVARSAISISL